MAVAAIGAVTALASLAYNAYKDSEAKKGLNKISAQKFPNYSLSPQLKSAYDQSVTDAQHGFTPAETAAFTNSLARQNNLSYRRATDSAGGNLASAINRGLQSQNIGALNQFAGQDAAMQRGNIRYRDTLAQALQHNQNLQSQADISHRVMLEQAYGKAESDAQMGMVNSGLAFGNALAYGAANNQGGGQRSAGGAAQGIPATTGGTPQSYMNQAYPNQPQSYVSNKLSNYAGPAPTTDYSSPGIYRDINVDAYDF